VGLFILTLVDLFGLNMGYNPATATNLLYPETPELSYLQQQPGDFRISGTGKEGGSVSLIPNSASVYGLDDVRGYDAIFPVTNYRMLATIDTPAYEFAPGVPYENITLLNNPGSPVMDLLGVRYILSSAGSLTEPSDDLWSGYGTAIKHSSQEASLSPSPYPVSIAGETKQAVFAHPDSAVQFPTAAPATSMLSVSFGIDPQAWEHGTDGVQFQVLIGTGSGPPVVALDRFVDPVHNPADRRWITTAIDLTAYLGKPITLVFATHAGPQGNLAYDWAYWGDPHFVRPSLGAHYVPVFQGKGGTIFKNTQVLPRAFLIGAVRTVPNDDAAWQAVADPQFDPRAAAILTQPASQGYIGGGRATEPGNARITHYGLNDVTVEYQADGQAILVLSDAYDSGWHAQVDGRDAPLLRVDYNLRGVVVPAGEHTVTYRYRPQSFIIGATVSGGTLALTGAILLVAPLLTRRRRRRQSRP
jgi:hypothetical protein